MIGLLSVHIGSWARGFLACIVFLFAFSSVIGNYYYGETNIEYLKTSESWIFVYRVAVVAMVLFGSVAKVSIVWDLADLFMALMALTNFVAIMLLGKFAFAALKDYVEQKRDGQNPIFYTDSIEGLTNIECWEKRHESIHKDTEKIAVAASSVSIQD